MALGTAWGTSYFGGTTTVQDGWWEAGLGGHGYAIDHKQEWVRQTVEMIRAQADTSDRPGEASLNPAGLWNRAQESWHHGAGQTWLDRADTDPFRFDTSKGVNPWDPYGLTLLPATTRSLASSNTGLGLCVFGGQPYVTDGANVRHYTGTAWTALGSPPSATATSIASDGHAIYVAYGSSGLYTSTGGALSSWATGTVNLVRYVKGRLIAAAGTKVYNVIATGALPTALLDHANTSWTWTDAAEGQGNIYLSGYAGDQSLVYRTAITPDGTALTAPIVAGALPDGELALSLTGYLGFLVIGTNLGVRFAAADPQDGNLTLGALIETPGSVLCGEGQDRFVWYGLTNYDDESTGLGRLDLKTFTSSVTPAYASDLMATGQGTVTSVVTVDGKRWFAVAGLGVFTESATVASGTMSSGKVGFGIPYDKTALAMEVGHEPLTPGTSVVLGLSVDGGEPVPVGASDLAGTTTATPGTLIVNQETGSFFEWHITINGNVTLRRVTLLADPNATRTELIVVPILLDETVNLNGVDYPVDVYAEWSYLRELCLSGRPVTYQHGRFGQRVKVEDFTWTPRGQTQDLSFFEGTFQVRLKSR